jgi:hypothetical protein
MPIRNGRPVQGQFTLDRNGFAITGHASAVTDFTDREEVDQVYTGEVAELVKSRTGADRVATLGWTLRRSAAPAESASQPQAALVQDDFSVAGARGRAGTAYASHFPGGPGFRRALITSLWRVFSLPPQDWRRDPLLQVQRQRPLTRLARSAHRIPRQDGPGDPAAAQHRIPHIAYFE